PATTPILPTTPRFHTSAYLSVSYVYLTKPENLEAAIRPETKLVWIETPTNPMLKIVDIEAVARIAHAKGLKVGCDNTFASPYCHDRKSTRLKSRHVTT